MLQLSPWSRTCSKQVWDMNKIFKWKLYIMKCTTLKRIAHICTIVFVTERCSLPAASFPFAILWRSQNARKHESSNFKKTAQFLTFLNSTTVQQHLWNTSAFCRTECHSFKSISELKNIVTYADNRFLKIFVFEFKILRYVR